MTELPKRKRGRPSKADQNARRLAALKTVETEEQRIDRISERFTVMYQLTKGAVSGHIRSLIISGAPGVGKSYIIGRVLEAAHDLGQIKYDIIHGIGTPVQLFKLMYGLRESNQILVLDDADPIYDNEEAVTLLKAGLDTTGRRVISWLAESSVLKADDIPQRFEYKGSMIFITNKDFQGEIDFMKSKLTPHYQALMSRSIYLDLKLHSPDDLVAWISHSVRKHGILLQKGITKEMQETALTFLKEHYMDFRELSIRSMMKLADFMSTANDWEKFARVTILR